MSRPAAETGPTEPDECDVVVVGGGIAGLAAAWSLRARDVRVLEAQDRVGGRVKSEVRGRYWLNFGAHVFGGPESATGRLLDELGIAAVTVPRRARRRCLPRPLPRGRARRDVSAQASALVGRADRACARRRPSPPRGRTLRAHRASARRGAGARAAGACASLSRRPAVLGVSRRRAGRGRRALPADDPALVRRARGRRRGLRNRVLPPRLEPRRGPLTQYRRRPRDAHRDDRRAPRHADRHRSERGGGDAGRRRRPRPVHARGPRQGASRALRDRGDACVRDTGDRARPARRDRARARRDRLWTVRRRGHPHRRDGTDAVGRRLRGRDAGAVVQHAVQHGEHRPPGRRAPTGGREPDGVLRPELGRRMAALDDGAVADTYVRDLEELFPEARGIVRDVAIQRWERGLPYPRPGRYRVQPALERPLGKVFLAGDYLGTWYTETAISSGVAAAAAVRDRVDES